MSAETDLYKLTKWKTTRRPQAGRLGVEVVDIFKRDLEKRQKKFGHIGEVWMKVIPAALQEASELTALSRGVLTVIVQGSTHLYNLKQGLLSGLQDQLLHACRGDGLKKINLKPGRLTR
ncbi:MAG: hypothetical protein H7144_08330 [Burkholderiales bacterium]|nr:hypothetical protein [Phycisphaerae bacterium]